MAITKGKIMQNNENQPSDFESRLKELYLPSADNFSIVDVPNAQFAMIDGTNPQSDEFKQAIEWLFKTIYPIKKIAKQRMGKNFKEPPLECQYRGDNFTQWRLMIVLPDWADDEMFKDAITTTERKLGKPPISLKKEDFKEGKCVQIMHIGAPKTQQTTIDKLHNQYLPSHNLTARGYHHEIYLNDASRVAPDKLKTVLRQPVS